MTNTAPNGSNSKLVLNEDGYVVIQSYQFGFSDPDSGAALAAVRVDTLPSIGVLALAGVPVTQGQVISVADLNAAKLTYAPPHDASGNALANLTFSVSDGTDFDPTPNTLTFDVYPVADAPSLTLVGAAGPTPAAGWTAGPVLAADESWQNQFGEKMTVLTNGNIVVSWFERPSAANGNEGVHYLTIVSPSGQIVAQTSYQFDNYTGAPGTLQVNTSRQPGSVVAIGDGLFTAVWDVELSNDPQGIRREIRYQIFDGLGNAVTSEAVLSRKTSGGGYVDIHDGGSDVETLSNGNAVVALLQSQTVTGPYSSSNDCVIHVISPSGTLVRTIDLEVGAPSTQSVQVAAVNGGGFLVTWSEDSTGPNSTIVTQGRAQLFDASGVATGPAFAFGAANLARPLLVETLSNGNSVVVRTSSTGTPTISIQIVDASGQALTADVPQAWPTLSGTFASGPSVVNAGDGSFVLMFQSTLGAYLQRYLNDGTRIGALVNISSGAGYSGNLALAPDGQIVVMHQTVGTDTSANDFYVRKYALPALPQVNAAQALAITTATTDIDGSESIAAVTVTGLPVGFTITDGTHAVTATSATQQIAVTGWDIAHLSVDAAPGYTGNIALTVSSTSKETVGGSQTSTSKLVELAFISGPSSNAAPIANADGYSVAYGHGATGNVLTGGGSTADSDPDGGPLMASLVTGPAHGTLDLHTDGTFTYTPTAGYVGSDSFTYVAFDGQDTSAPVTASFNMAANTAPVGYNDAFTMPAGTVLNGNVIADNGNGADADPEGAALTVSNRTNPQHGSLTLRPDGTFTYTPTAGYIGSDSFTYTASDGQLSTVPVTVALTVTAPNQAPVARDDSITGRSGAPITGNVIVSNGHGIDYDPDGSPLTAVLDSTPSHGTVTMAADGTFSYVQDGAYASQDSFTYHVTDGQLSSGTAVVTLLVDANAAPVGSPTVVLSAGTEDVPYTVTTAQLVQGLSDPDGDSLSVVGLTASTGSVADNGDGTFTITPPANYYGDVTLTYTVSDGYGGQRAGLTRGFNLAAVNDAPMFDGAVRFAVPENAKSVGSVHATDSDVGAVVRYAIVGGDDAAKLRIDSVTGALSFLLAPDYEAPTDANRDNSYDVIVSATDGKLSSTSTIAVNVTDVAGMVRVGGVGNDNLAGATEADTLVGGAGNDTLAGFGADDLLIGGAGADLVNGGLGNDTLGAGAGNDTMNGGAGRDAASYADATAGVRVNLAIATAQNTLGAGVDLLTGVEDLFGSAYNDTLTGGAGANAISGGMGDDLIVGGAFGDRLDGGGGAGDTVSYATSLLGVNVDLRLQDGLTAQAHFWTGSAGALNGDATGDILSSFENVRGSAKADRLTGDGGDNVIEGGLGADTLDGGGALTGDTLSYAHSAVGVIVNLETGKTGGGDAAGDLIANFANVLGSNAVDKLKGDDNANVLTGGLGADILTGGAGNDHFVYRSLSEAGDHITDYLSGSDVIEIMASGFQGPGSGNLVSGQTLDATTFVSTSGTGLPRPTTSAATFLYDQDNGRLYFDADGTGGLRAAALLLTLDGHPTLAAADLKIV